MWQVDKLHPLLLWVKREKPVKLFSVDFMITGHTIFASTVQVHQQIKVRNISNIIFAFPNMIFRFGNFISSNSALLWHSSSARFRLLTYVQKVSISNYYLCWCPYIKKRKQQKSQDSPFKKDGSKNSDIRPTPCSWPNLRHIFNTVGQCLLQNNSVCFLVGLRNSFIEPLKVMFYLCVWNMPKAQVVSYMIIQSV